MFHRAIHFYGFRVTRPVHVFKECSGGWLSAQGRIEGENFKRRADRGRTWGLIALAGKSARFTRQCSRALYYSSVCDPFVEFVRWIIGNVRVSRSTSWFFSPDFLSDMKLCTYVFRAINFRSDKRRVFFFFFFCDGDLFIVTSAISKKIFFFNLFNLF